MPLFPPKTTRMLRYSASFALTCTSGVVNSYVFRANDCYDPDFTGTGHQPMGFDQMMLSYDHFCVRRARLIATAVTATGTYGTICIRYDGGSTPLTVIDRILEVGGCVTDTVSTGGAIGASKTIELSLDIASLHGLRPDALLADPELRGDVATSPVELSYFHVAMWNVVGVTVSAYFDVILEQEVTFTEPRALTES